MSDAIERVFMPEHRADMQAGNRLSGHASVFGRLANIGIRYEEIMPSAWEEVLRRGDDIFFLRNHDEDKILGRTTSGTLRLALDETGLIVDDDLPDTPLGHETRELVRRRDLTGFSFGYKPDPQSDTFRRAPDGKEVVQRNSFQRCVDVSLATYPAYKDANDAVLRSVDFSKSMALVLPNRDRILRARAAGYRK